MHLHILGISGTFMSALAILAREAGYVVSGCDANCYPPVSDLLKEKGIEWIEGYEDHSLAVKADTIIVGNAVKRGMPVIEAVLDRGKNYRSGPQWLAENVLSRYKVMAVAGTHGKTTTTSMLAFILEHAGLKPGFLIGGIAPNFNTSARLGTGSWFAIEADEYDSAFFDKRPKLMHYQPQVAILNNLEFDHADIYPNLEAIQQQFHYYLKTIPPKGVVLKPRDDKALNEVISKGGVFSNLENLALDGESTWRAQLLEANGASFNVFYKNKKVAEVSWPLVGNFNVENALAALAASSHAGVPSEIAGKALEAFKPVKRRLEVKSNKKGITIYDDFAHHPTAIQKTVQALVNSQRHQRILVVLEFGSFTMRSGVHAQQMGSALTGSDFVYILKPQNFDLTEVTKLWDYPYHILPSTTEIVHAVVKEAREGDAILVMSNRGFDGIHKALVDQVDAKP